MEHLTDTQFEQEVAKNSRLVLIDFYADWCQPCKILSPLLEELAGEYSDKLTFYKMDVDKNAQTPQKYGVRGIPTLVILDNGEVKDKLIGAVSKEKLREFIQKNL